MRSDKIIELMKAYQVLVNDLSTFIPLNKSQETFIVYTLIEKVFFDKFFSEFIDIDKIPKTTGKLIEYFKEQHNFDKQQILEIILSSPPILLYSDRIEDIYCIAKQGEYKATVLANEDKFKSYKNDSSLIKYIDLIDGENRNNALILKCLVQGIKESDYYMDTILSSTSRKDIATYYGIDEKDNTKQILEKLNEKVKENDKKSYFITKSTKSNYDNEKPTGKVI